MFFLYPGSWIWIFFHPGSRGHKSTGFRIPYPDPHHCREVWKACLILPPLPCVKLQKIIHYDNRIFFYHHLITPIVLGLCTWKMRVPNIFDNFIINSVNTVLYCVAYIHVDCSYKFCFGCMGIRCNHTGWKFNY
jgi:hypothetical protein